MKKGKAHLRLLKDLEHVHEDWEMLKKKKTNYKDSKFLNKVAKDITQLNLDASQAEKVKSLKEKAELVNYLLTTPWGAPFVGETTLLEAAQSFKGENPSTSHLSHLMRDFATYGRKFDTQIFKFFDDLFDELS